MKILILLLTLMSVALTPLTAQSDVEKLLDGLNIELDENSGKQLEDWIKSIDNVDFEWTSDFSSVERKKIGRRYEELITVRSGEGQQFYVYGGHKKGTDELLLIAQLEDQYVRVSLTGDFDFK